MSWPSELNRDSKLLIHFCYLLQETLVLDVNGNVEKISSFTDYSFFNFQTPFLKKRISRFVLFLFSETFVLENWIFRDSIISFNFFEQTGLIAMEFMFYFLKLLCKQDLS